MPALMMDDSAAGEVETTPAQPVPRKPPPKPSARPARRRTAATGAMNHIIAENFMRSAKAPAMIAGVMTAKVIWYIRKTFPAPSWRRGMDVARRPAPKARDSEPIAPLSARHR